MCCVALSLLACSHNVRRGGRRIRRGAAAAKARTNTSARFRIPSAPSVHAAGRRSRRIHSSSRAAEQYAAFSLSQHARICRCRRALPRRSRCPRELARSFRYATAAHRPASHRAALLQACRVEGTGTNARPSSIGGRTGAPSRALLADELLPRALRNWWLWSAEEKAALEAVAAEPQTRSTVPLPPPPPQPAATYRSFAAAAPASLGKRPVPTYRTLGAAATGDAMSSQGSQGSESQPSQSQPPPLPPSHVSGGKLELVLDLDHTLVHACELHSDALPPSDAHTFSLRPHLGAPEARYKLKLRDGVRAFLKEARSFCTLHVYTMGSQSYTRQVLSLIDPALTFDGQILCRRDGDDAPFEKSVAHLVQNDKSLTDEASRNAMRDRMIVIDDRDEVWDVRSRPHVVLVPQFHAWHDDGTPSSRNADQVPDSTLVDVLHILRQVSSDLRSGADSVPALLRQRQRSILSGCVLVFSGGLLRDAHKPELSKSWRMAEALWRAARSSSTSERSRMSSPASQTQTAFTRRLQTIYMRSRTSGYRIRICAGQSKKRGSTRLELPGGAADRGRRADLPLACSTTASRRDSSARPGHHPSASRGRVD